MPRSRDTERKLIKNPTCSFCGSHKDDVPLMIASNNTDARICANCALGVIEQTFGHMLNMEALIRKAITPAPPPRTIITGGKETDAAIRKVTAKQTG